MSSSAKDRIARGGKTKHQSLKEQRKTRYKSAHDPNQRIKELQAHQTQLDEIRAGNGPKAQSEGKKVKRINMWASTIERRIGALNRLKTQIIAAEKDILDEFKIDSPEHKFFLGTDWLSVRKNQINTLQHRI